MYRVFRRYNPLGASLIKSHSNADSSLQLQSGARIGVVGGGPAGSLFSYFLLQLAASVGLDLAVDIFEPRHFDHFGPAGCNHCGGIISESLVQLLALDGINLPPEVVQRGVDAYVLHTDVGSVRIETPLHERRIASIYRGGGPRGSDPKVVDWQSFDGFLLDLAQKSGARLRRAMITDLKWQTTAVQIATPGKHSESYDLVVLASGVNSKLLAMLDKSGLNFRPPTTTTAFISEFHLGADLVQKYLGTAMHVFLLDLPRLKFAALIPKQNFVTVCLLGDNIDRALVQAFLDSPEVRRCLPPVTSQFNIANCHCLPRLNIKNGGVLTSSFPSGFGSPQPFADRMLFIGDAGVTRLYKDGIGAAYRTAKAAASAAILGGVAAADFKHHFQPICAKIAMDNAIGKFVFKVAGIIQSLRFSRRAMICMIAYEQANAGAYRPMSTTMWDLFTGSAPYQDILLGTLQPSFIISLLGNMLRALVPYANNTIVQGNDP